MDTKKILIVNPSFLVNGGAERVISQFGNWCTENYIKTTILTTKINEDFIKDLTETRLIPCKDLNEMAAVLSEIHTDFDAIFFHNHPAQLLSRFSRGFNIWLCNEPQSYLDTGKVPDEEKRIVNEFIDKVIVADDVNAERFEKLYGIKPEVIPYGIDYDFFSEKVESNFKKENDIEDEVVITQVGFVADTKDSKKTYEIFKELNKRKKAKLVYVGYDKLPYAQELKDKIAQEGHMGDVIFTGLINREKLREVYAATDVVVMPNKGQGSWLTVFEAMSAGKPVVVSEQMCCRDIAKTITADKVEDYVNAIINAIIEESKPDTKFIQKMTWSNFSKKVLGVMNDNKQNTD